MTRKSKQAGGHQPLTHYERTKKFKSSHYGTTTARLSTESQGNFGDCCLSLQPAENPVATPSGRIYSQEAILEYLLTKTAELKQQKQKYEAYIASQNKEEQKRLEKEQDESIAKFESTQRATKNVAKKEKEPSKKEILKSTSYWLAEVQPEHIDRAPSPPPDRPTSPFSGQPLRRKDLIPLVLERDASGKVECAVSNKTITTQPVVALTKSGHVILEDVYEKLVKPNMTCPITGQKLKAKHVLKLQKGRSGFASSGEVQAKTYRPTIT